MPAYKSRFLSEAIDSILQQDYTEFNLIIIDDCSPENLWETVSCYSDNRIKYYRNDNNIGGNNLVAQWNYCLTLCDSDYIILATDDDIYEKKFLSTFIDLIYKYPNVNIFRARVLSVDSNNNIKYLDNCYKEYLSQVEFYYYMLHGMRGGIPQYIFKRKPLLESGGFINFPLAWASDDATALNLSTNGVVTSQEHLVRFRWSDINISSNNHLGIEKLQARLLFYEWICKHKPVFDYSLEWNKFYTNNVINYLSTYNKITIISTIRSMLLLQKIKSLKIITFYRNISLKDKLSIIFHSIK